MNKNLEKYIQLSKEERVSSLQKLIDRLSDLRKDDIDKFIVTGLSHHSVDITLWSVRVGSYLLMAQESNSDLSPDDNPFKPPTALSILRIERFGCHRGEFASCEVVYDWWEDDKDEEDEDVESLVETLEEDLRWKI